MTVRKRLVFALLAVVIACFALGCIKPKEPKVLVQAFYPFTEGHQYIIDYVLSLEKQFPDKVTAEAYDMQDSTDRKVWSKTGLGCAGVFVNGRTRHTIKQANGETETVDFLKRMDSFWSKEDFETVLKAEMANPSTWPEGGYSTQEAGLAAAGEQPAGEGE